MAAGASLRQSEGMAKVGEGSRRLTDWRERDSVDGGILEEMEIYDRVDVGELKKGGRRDI